MYMSFVCRGVLEELSVDEHKSWRGYFIVSLHSVEPQQKANTYAVVVPYLSARV